MTRTQLLTKIQELHEAIDSTVDEVEKAALEAQKAIYEVLVNQIERFEITDGRFVVTQNFAKRIAIVEEKIENILGNVYAPSVKEYLNVFSTIDDTHISLHKSYNQLEVDKKLLKPARMMVYNMAEHYMTSGLKEIYVQPAKYLLMQQVTQGITIKDSRKILDKWNEGSTVGDVTPVPNLASYSSQLARDAAYQHQGAINEIISGHYNLDHFIYTGNIIEKSRPLCRHLIWLQRDIALSEIPALLTKYPQGLYPETNEGNFITRRGGYNCRHEAFPVKPRKKKKQ